MLPTLPVAFKKWGTMVGAVLIQLTLGYYYTFGNINPYLTSYLRDFVDKEIRYSDSIWINSTMAIMQSVTSILSGFLILKFRLSLKLVTFIGCVIMSAGIILTFFAIKSSFWMTLLTHGFLNGFGMGMAYVPPMGCVMRWFPRSKGLANSVVLFGYGVGGMFITQIQTRFVNPEDSAPDEPFPGSLKEKYYSKEHNMALLERVPQNFLLTGFIILGLQIIGAMLLFDPSEVKQETAPSFSPNLDNSSETKIPINNDNTSISSQNDSLNEVSQSNDQSQVSDRNSLGVRYGVADSGLSISEVIKLPSFYMIWFIYAFTAVLPGVISAEYKTFGEEFITGDNFLSDVGSAASLTNALGRFFWGFLMDKLPFKICMLILNTALIALTSTLYLTEFINNDFVYLIWICAIFFTFCGIYVIMPTVTAKCFGQKNFTLIYGLVFTTGIVSNVVTANLAAMSKSVGWFGLFLTLSGFVAISWIICVFFNVKKADGDDI